MIYITLNQQASFDCFVSNGEDEKCTSSHEGKLLLQQEFPINIDQLFTMIFTNSKFNLELLAARDTSDYVQVYTPHITTHIELPFAFVLSRTS